MPNIISFFQKLIKRRGGGWNKGGGGLETFSKINKRGGRLFGIREYANSYDRYTEMLQRILVLFQLFVTIWKIKMPDQETVIKIRTWH